jgi:hypothetical protein
MEPTIDAFPSQVFLSQTDRSAWICDDPKVCHCDHENHTINVLPRILTATREHFWEFGNSCMQAFVLRWIHSPDLKLSGAIAGFPAIETIFPGPDRSVWPSCQGQRRCPTQLVESWREDSLCTDLSKHSLARRKASGTDGQVRLAKKASSLWNLFPSQKIKEMSNNASSSTRIAYEEETFA